VPFIECRHLDSKAVFDLCAHPQLLAVARSLYGEDLILWRSTFIEKEEGGPEYRWHQDWGGVYGQGDEYGLEPPLLFTFWIAISEATEDNGCLRFVPGIRRVVPATPASDGPRATMLISDGEIDTSNAVSMPLRPGQCVVFTDRAVHASGGNHGTEGRLGLAVRFTLSTVRVRPHFAGHACVLASGRDNSGVNTLQDSPK
jgi:ectoine hydroxylase-related dioxygenase (phytanoyl-CoA dioxygenase family)